MYESRNIQPYARELGLSRNYSAIARAKGYPSYIPGVTIIDIDPRYMPHDSILGMTDLRTIWLRNDLENLRSEVLDHENMHIKFPHLSEREIRERTRIHRMSRGHSCYLH